MSGSARETRASSRRWWSWLRACQAHSQVASASAPAKEEEQGGPRRPLPAAIVQSPRLDHDPDGQRRGQGVGQRGEGERQEQGNRQWAPHARRRARHRSPRARRVRAPAEEERLAHSAPVHQALERQVVQAPERAGRGDASSDHQPAVRAVAASALVVGQVNDAGGGADGRPVWMDRSRKRTPCGSMGQRSVHRPCPPSRHARGVLKQARARRAAATLDGGHEDRHPSRVRRGPRPLHLRQRVHDPLHPAEIHVEICSNCHPFYTGRQKLVDTGGRVERFKRRAAKRGART